MSDVDTELAKLWTTLLACDDVDQDSDFFARGGTSFDVVYLTSMVHETFGIEIEAVEIFERSRFADLSALIASRLTN